MGVEVNPSGSTQRRRRSDGPITDGEMEVARTAVTRALLDCRAHLEISLSPLREDGPRQPVLESLQSAVAEFARVTRWLGVPPERVIVIFKSMVRELSPIQPWRGTERDALTGELVEIMIEAYYAGSNRNDGDGPPLDSRSG